MPPVNLELNILIFIHITIGNFGIGHNPPDSAGFIQTVLAVNL